MVSAYVLVSVDPGKNQEVVATLRQVAGVTQAHACWASPTSSPTSTSTTTVPWPTPCSGRFMPSRASGTAETHLVTPV
jgi:hypothetical protein